MRFFFSVNIKGKNATRYGPRCTDKCLKLSSQKKKKKKEGTEYGVHTPTMAEPGFQGYVSGG